jgi:hypothetical protein
MGEKRFYEPVVEELGAGQWGVWIDDGDEICVCDSRAEAERVKDALIEYRDKVVDVALKAAQRITRTESR